MTSPAGGSNRPSGSIVVALFLIVALGLLVLLGCFTALQLPDPVTAQARKIHTLYQATLAISMVIYFGVTAGIIWAILRYRRTSRDLPRQIHGSSTLEIGWTAIPIIILVALFIPSFLLVLDLKTPPDADEVDVTVEVIGTQWFWQFIYCQNGESPDECRDNRNNLRVSCTVPDCYTPTPSVAVLPTDNTVRMYVRSTDVVHSFYWPHSLYKIQAIPGNVNEMHFKIEKEGSYSGQCYQFCGLRHSDMLFVIDARSGPDFQRWLTEQRRAQGLDIEPQRSATTGND